MTSEKKADAMTLTDAAVLSHDPFDGDFGGPGDRTLSDKIVKARTGGECHDCADPIIPGQRIRTRTDIADGELMSFRWCQACCEAMAVYEENPDILDSRIAQGQSKRLPPMSNRKPSGKPTYPEPCFGGTCRSPGVCADWGYCRERNQGRAPSNELQSIFRDAAALCREMAAKGKTP